MKNLLTTLILILIIQTLSACASQKPTTIDDYARTQGVRDNRDTYTMERNKWSDKNMRISVQPHVNGCDEVDTADIQAQLMKQNKWTIVDRQAGYRSAFGEQDLVHLQKADRFANNYKYSHFGKMSGVGSIVIPKCYCGRDLYGGDTMCDIGLSLVDASTGEVIIAVGGEYRRHYGRSINWEDLVEEFTERYPRKFEGDQEYKSLKDYQAETRENAHQKKYQ